MPLLTPTDIRALAERLGVRPTKRLGQNFVHDGGTVRRIAAAGSVNAEDVVLEIGPGLGSLTLALLETGARVIAVEIDPVLAGALEGTVQEMMPEAADRLRVINRDALTITTLSDLGAGEGARQSGESAVPTKLVANLPYNVAVPVILTLLANLPSLREVLVMVQLEVAERLAAAPGGKTYGAPSAKAAWYGEASLAGMISRSVFWPVPNVDSALVRIVRTDDVERMASREDTFAVVDAAFSQRRKTLRAALAGWAGSPQQAETYLRAAGIDPTRRGETLTIDDFAAIATAREQVDKEADA